LDETTSAIEGLNKSIDAQEKKMARLNSASERKSAGEL